jgi:hypothetical protein
MADFQYLLSCNLSIYLFSGLRDPILSEAAGEGRVLSFRLRRAVPFGMVLVEAGHEGEY